MVTEYGRWPETAGGPDGKVPKGKFVLGLDIGTTGTQAVVLSDGALYAYAGIRTGYDFAAAAEAAAAKALGLAGLSRQDVDSVAATGFGRKNAASAAKVFDEITCHGFGARYVFGPEVRTVVDLGGQRTKAIRLYDWDRIRDFKLDDKCANGFGRKIEMMANLLAVPITEMGERSLDVAADPEPVSTTCPNFMYPETIGLLRQGFREDEYSENEVLAACLFTVTWRALSTVGKLAPLDIGEIVLEAGVGFTGGVAKNPGVTKRIERELKIEALTPKCDAQLAGAIGAALLA
jgi:benzoyl-CoA reductase subunit A